MSSTSVDTVRVGSFLGLAFGISWVSAVIFYASGIEYGTLTSLVLVTVFFMWAPAIAAIAFHLWHGESIRKGCGLRVGRLRWIVLAWVGPVFLVGGTIGVGVLLPGVEFSTDYATFLVESGLTESQVDAALAQLDAIPGPPVALFVGQGLLAGLTINALAALGEELGWRGLLLSELAPLGFWKVSGVTGVIWGLWHAPIILQGHNFPDAPVLGVVVMTVAMVAMAPIYTYITVRARSVLAPTFFHGSFNGLGGLSMVYLAGAGNLVTAPVGIAGIAAAIVVTGLCVIHDRSIADDRITTGQPLNPWE